MKQNDVEIIQEILRGGEHGYAILLQRYRARVFSLALRLIGRREEAEEAAQDAFIRAFRSLASFEQRSRFSTWLYRITYNVALDHRSRMQKSRRQFSEETADEVADDHPPMDLRLEREELKEIVKNRIAHLRPEYSAILTLFYLHDQSYEEIADILSLPLGTVKNRLHRARGILRSHVIRHYTMPETS